MASKQALVDSWNREVPAVPLRARAEGQVTRAIRRLVRGMRYSEKYGSHPGTVPLLMFVVLGGLASLSRGWLYGLCGAGAVLITFGIVYLYGCWERGV